MTIDLSPGEHVIWQGQPTQGIRFAGQDAFAIPFAIFWLGIVLSIFLVSLTGVAKDVDPIAYVILPMFLVIGLYMLVGRFLVDRAGRRHTNYYLTNKRAIIEAGRWRPSQRSVSLAAVPEIRYRGGRKGRGTVQFGSLGPFAMMPPSWPGASQFLPPAFDDIEEAERVYNLVLSAQRDAQAAR